jgi:hypothetical protein
MPIPTTKPDTLAALLRLLPTSVPAALVGQMRANAAGLPPLGPAPSSHVLEN